MDPQRRPTGRFTAPLPAIPPRIRSQFPRRLVNWFAAHGRDLPWRRTRDPYRILVSEILLHQTQVARVLETYARFLRQYPTLAHLARGRLRAVKAITDPLGYKIRGNWLHAIARQVMRDHGGAFPREPETLARLCGVGPYTANAIRCFAFGEAVPLVDANVARVWERLFGLERDRASAAGRRRLWFYSEALLPADDAWRFNQGLMDFGATVCRPRVPRCEVCPMTDFCATYAAAYRTRSTARRVAEP
ncbi:MAG: A/G-specific adenine glycosylase [Gemmatimonadota bacterium]